MKGSDASEINALDDPVLASEEMTLLFRNALEELCITQSSLAYKMKTLNDHRPVKTILRSIQRMASGDARVSGEMQVILEMMNRERRRSKYEARGISWKEVEGGCVTTRSKDFDITLSPASKGRWHIHLRHKGGYSPPWASWQPDLEAAKLKSILILNDAADELHKIMDGS
jgi:hypothetical protein